MDSFSPDRRSTGRADSASRRTRLRLRELCDEVLASHRVAKGHAPLSETERADAHALLAQVAPPMASAPRLTLAE